MLCYDASFGHTLGYTLNVTLTRTASELSTVTAVTLCPPPPQKKDALDMCPIHKSLSAESMSLICLHAASHFYNR
jgi:hypothetical protein